MADETPEWPPAELDFNKPTIARAYDALLGGKDNFAVDRQLADQTAALIPGLRESAVENRKVLVRGVRYLAREAGMDQFLDLGSGLPTVENTHEVAQRENPRARVVYVDIDPLVAVHGRALLANNDVTKFMTADVRDPEAVLAAPEVKDLLDFSRPAVIMLVGMLHYLSPDVVDEVVAAYRDVLAPGSHLFMTFPGRHGSAAAAGARPHHPREPRRGLGPDARGDRGPVRRLRARRAGRDVHGAMASRRAGRPRQPDSRRAARHGGHRHQALTPPPYGDSSSDRLRTRAVRGLFSPLVLVCEVSPVLAGKGGGKRDPS